ncbi:MAG: peptidoglycan-binding protein [Roseovarius sp.]|nr:peptidoglycan-binding protein [Roseovarius sp.]
MEEQAALNYFGFPAGAPDGVRGRNTRSAASQFQAHMGYPATGNLTEYERQFLVSSYYRAQSNPTQTAQLVAQRGMGTRGAAACLSRRDDGHDGRRRCRHWRRGDDGLDARTVGAGDHLRHERAAQPDGRRRRRALAGLALQPGQPGDQFQRRFRHRRIADRRAICTQRTVLPGADLRDLGRRGGGSQSLGGQQRPARRAVRRHRPGDARLRLGGVAGVARQGDR